MKKLPLKERIVETALVMFEKHGYHGVTVGQIVDECGTSKGGFYHNFKSKDELLYHIHDVFISYVLDKAREAYDNFDTPVSRLCAIIQSFTKVFDLYKPHITVFYQESTYLVGDFYQKINEKRDEYRKIIVQVIKEGQVNGDFRSEVPAEISTMSIIGMINWTYKWFSKEGPLSIDEIALVFNDLILHSLLTEKGMKDEAVNTYLLKSQPLSF
ncbi:TetR/AcrR family transcriptional regulator [Bacillus sp. DTU_2020_1000418_1_SI_GHA_SEK_038]|uniref:TetR/AcrR family transcriptional regulator n=1 Tax=Bacillus sp. DTU_2020_1000418_1_SI_GHA_SEK_038 TaxID=3077585 RepID=UPI0028F0ADA8|nr:TetR/AcrR family transcriptional regulator [Bacillus sp. DTU_2020_1000418_1_SI_GHA_SEK_038]WNS73616.1 TetR/AcrR family transcriptional regulator [Bacillus sp. DTU_2020_1000418_1_SI_GHA_SEK_038]